MKYLGMLANRLELASVMWVAALLLIDVGILNAHPPRGAEEIGTVAESPVPGVRIIREKDFDKQPAHYLSSNLYTTLASARDNLNKFVAFDFQVTPGGGPLPHTHSNEWETFFVHQGEVTFTVGVNPDPNNPALSGSFRTQRIPAGTLVYGPQGPVHGFFNNSGAPARIFSFAMPAGLDNFFVTSGEQVTDFDAPIPQISFEEILRTAFWAEQRGDGLHFLGTPIPPPCTPHSPDVVCPTEVVASITDHSRPTSIGTFGEARVRLLKQEETGNITGATAFCGPGRPGRAGGSVTYDYVSVPRGNRFPALVSSRNIEVFHVLDGTLSFKFANGKRVDVPELTYVEIQADVPFSIASTKKVGGAASLNVSVIAPTCPPPPVGPSPGATTLGVERTPSGKLPGRESAEDILERYRKRH